MYNFSKFLADKEDLILVFRAKKGRAAMLWSGALLLLAFFVLLPLWRAGNNGLLLWTISVLIASFILLVSIIDRYNYYILTNHRLIFLKFINKETYQFIGDIDLTKINSAHPSGRHHIMLIIGNRKKYLVNVDNRDQVYNKIKFYLRGQNLV
mgnify:CR=1 FL=1